MGLFSLRAKSSFVSNCHSQDLIHMMTLFVKYKCDWCRGPALCKPAIGSRLSWLQTSLRSWMARLSVSLAADAIRCLHGRQILLDTFKHKDVCWVVRRSVCATLSENPSFLGAVLFYLQLSSSNRQKHNLFASHSSFIRAKIVTGLLFFLREFISWIGTNSGRNICTGENI